MASVSVRDNNGLQATRRQRRAPEAKRQAPSIKVIAMSRVLKSRLSSIIALLNFLGISASALANPQIAAIPGARANMNVLPPRGVRSDAFPYAHQVTFALPASYAAQPELAYPVL